MNRRVCRRFVRSSSNRRDVLCSARLLLGLSLRAEGISAAATTVSPRAARALAFVPPGGSYFISGPSGSGKTTHLRSLVRDLHARGAAVITMNGRRLWAASSKRLIDLGHGLGIKRWLAILAHAGLAEAGLFAKPLRDLSTGQRHRTAAADMLARAERRRQRSACAADELWIVADELTSGLDRPTAFSLAAGLARFIAGTRHDTVPMRLLVTTHDRSFAEAIRPEVEVVCRLNAPAAFFTRSRRRRAS